MLSNIKNSLTSFATDTVIPQESNAPVVKATLDGLDGKLGVKGEYSISSVS